MKVCMVLSRLRIDFDPGVIVFAESTTQERLTVSTDSDRVDRCRDEEINAL